MEQIKETNLLINITMSSPYNARVISCICRLPVLTTNFLLSVFQKDVYIFMKRKRNLENLHCKCIHFRFRILIYKMVLPTTL